MKTLTTIFCTLLLVSAIISCSVNAGESVVAVDSVATDSVVDTTVVATGILEQDSLVKDSL